MNVLLFKPNYIYDIAVIPPVGLCYIASILEKEGINVSIVDNTLENFPPRTIKKIVKKKKPTLVGISCSTPMIFEGFKLAKIVKEVNSKIHIIMGGPHPTSLPTEVLSNSFVDSVCICEGEFTFLELYKALEKGKSLSKIKGLVFKDSRGKVKFNKPRRFIQNLDDLPFPAYHLLDIEKYFKLQKTYGINTKYSRNLPIMTSRGCPGKCTFCSRFLGSVFRYRSPKNVVDEIEHLINRYKVKEIHFIDDNFTLLKKRAMEICDEIINRNLNISFKFPNGLREDFLDKELLKKLKEAGCYALDFGIESGSQKVLDLMKKGKKVEEIKKKVMLCKKMGFNLTASFIFGTPGETIEDMKKTIEFATSIPLDGADFGILIPYPGTEIFEKAKKNGQIKHFNYDKYIPTLGKVEPALETNEWNIEDLIKIQQIAYKKFYFRLKYILSMLPNLAKPQKVKKYINFFKESVH